MKPTTSPFIRVKKSVIHGIGVSAKIDIPKGQRVIEYTGEKITKAESDRRGPKLVEKAKKTGEGAVYIFELDDKYDIDGSVSWNTARFINHSCDPNCETEEGHGKIWITAIKDIKKGEELSYDYGYDLDEYEEHPCRCGAKRCVGYIVADIYWPRLKKLIAKKKKKEREAKAKAKKKAALQKKREAAKKKKRKKTK